MPIPKPGTWKYETGPSLKGRFHAVMGVVGDEVEMVAECYEGTEKSQKSNATFIASAPDMYAELEQVLEWARVEGAPLRTLEIESIERVLARARGRR